MSSKEEQIRPEKEPFLKTEIRRKERFFSPEVYGRRLIFWIVCRDAP